MRTGGLGSRHRDNAWRRPSTRCSAAQSPRGARRGPRARLGRHAGRPAFVRFRFVEDERHPGVVEIHLRDVDDRALLDVIRERGIVSFEEDAQEPKR